MKKDFKAEPKFLAKNIEESPRFVCFNDRGFQIQFNNGYKVSVMFGDCNYASSEKIEDGIRSPDAEIAVLKNQGGFCTRGVCAAMGLKDPGDAVLGRRTPKEVADIISFVSNLKPGSEEDSVVYNTPEYAWQP